MQMSTVEDAERTTAPVTESNGDAPPAQQVGQWAEVPPASKKNGPNSKFAPELNATAREAEKYPGKARVISVQKSVRSASGRASTIKRKLRDGTVNGLEFPAENFDIIPRGSVVYAVYAPKDSKPAAAAAKPDARPAAKAATPDPKTGTAKRK